ncbi:MAG: YciI family protein [Candidatus Saccharibacteria bacterium]|nr:YciI family protein [Candidatus Saccharibacteria bacterium]
MQFVIIGLDGTDNEAPARRQKVRQDHIKKGDELLASGNLWYGAALLHDDGSMKGSMYVMYFDNQEDFDDYLKTEPYVVGDVWKDITVHKSNTRDPWQFNRSEEWFKETEK